MFKLNPLTGQFQIVTQNTGSDYIIAASNASAAEKALANQVLNGMSDDVAINAAITAGYAVKLTGGQFNLSAALVETGDGTGSSKLQKLRGSGIDRTILQCNMNISGILLSRSGKYDMGDFTIIVGGSADGMRSTGSSTNPQWSFWQSKIDNIQVKSYNAHTGWAYNFSSPFRSKFYNLTAFGVKNGLWVKSSDPNFNPGNSVFETCMMDLSEPNGTAYRIESVDAGGLMNMLTFIECDCIDDNATSTTSIGWLIKGSATSYYTARNINVISSNPEQFNTDVKLMHAADSQVNLTYADVKPGGTIFDISADSSNNILTARSGYVAAGTTTTLINDANTNAAAPNSLSGFEAYVDTGATLAMGTTTNTQLANLSASGPGTISSKIGVYAKALDAAVAHNTGNESWDGIKTFIKSPIVPTPTTSGQVTNKGYVDAAVGAVSNAVTSVNTKVGAVTLGTGDIAESAGVLYFTDTRVTNSPQVVSNTSAISSLNSSVSSNTTAIGVINTSLATKVSLGGDLLGVNSTALAPILKNVEHVFVAEDYGAKSDAVKKTDVSTTAGTKVITSASGGFLATATVGMKVSIVAAKNTTDTSTLRTSIVSVDSDTQITLAANSATTLTNAVVVYGTDSGPGILAAIDAARAVGGQAIMQGSNYLLQTPIKRDASGIILRGRGMYNTTIYNGCDYGVAGLDFGNSSGPVARNGSYLEGFTVDMLTAPVWGIVYSWYSNVRGRDWRVINPGVGSFSMLHIGSYSNQQAGFATNDFNFDGCVIDPGNVNRTWESVTINYAYRVNFNRSIFLDKNQGSVWLNYNGEDVTCNQCYFRNSTIQGGGRGPANFNDCMFENVFIRLNGWGDVKFKGGTMRNTANSVKPSGIGFTGIYYTTSGPTTETPYYISSVPYFFANYGIVFDGVTMDFSNAYHVNAGRAYDSGSGLSFLNADDITMVNCKLMGSFWDGVHLFANKLTISNNKVFNSSQSGASGTQQNFFLGAKQGIFTGNISYDSQGTPTTLRDVVLSNENSDLIPTQDWKFAQNEFLVNPANPISYYNSGFTNTKPSNITVSNADIGAAPATTTSLGSIQLVNDLGGTATNPTTPTAIHITGNETAAGTKTWTGAQIINNALIGAFVVGPNGVTNPTFQVNTNVTGAVTGVLIKSNAAGAWANINTTSTNANETLSIDSKGTSSLRLQTNGGNGSIVMGQNAAIFSSSGQALAVGPNGSSSNQTFIVDSSAASAATGIKVKGAAAGSGAAITVISTAANENVTIDALGTGTITIGSVSSGAIALARPTTVTGLLTATGANLASGTTTVATPVNATDAANKGYVDAFSQGAIIHAAVQEATTAALPANTYSAGVLTATANGALTVDGIVVSTGDRIAVQNEATAANNGIYVVTNAGAAGAAYVLTRATDMNTGSQVPGATVYVEQGTYYSNAQIAVMGKGPFTIGTTSIVWTQVNGLGDISVGTGLAKNGNMLNLSNATTTTLGGIVLAGDLAGSAATPSLIAVGTAGTYGAANSVNVITTDTKGRVTVVTPTAIQITEAQVTNLTTDLAAKLTNPMTTVGDIIYGGTGGTPLRLAAGTSTQVLIGGTAPTYGAVALGTMVSGTLPVGNGGTGVTTSTGSGSNVLSNSPALVTPNFSSIINTGTLTLPTSTDTLLGRATTDTLTNKSISGATNTLTAIPLTTAVTGILPVGNGGSGTSTVFTQGSIVFAGASGVYSQSTSLWWDNSNGRLAIGKNSGATVGLNLASNQTIAMDLATPTGVTATASTGGTLAAGTYYFRVSASDRNGVTIGSTEVSATVDGTTTNRVVISWSAVFGAYYYNVYKGATAGNENLYRSTSLQNVQTAPPVTMNWDTDTGANSGTVPTTTNAYKFRFTSGTDSHVSGGNFGVGAAPAGTSYRLQVAGAVSAQAEAIGVRNISFADNDTHTWESGGGGQWRMVTGWTSNQGWQYYSGTMNSVTLAEAYRVDGKGNFSLRGGTNPSYGWDQYGGQWRMRALSTAGGPSVTNFGTAGTTSYIYYIVAKDSLGNRTLVSNGTTTATGNATLDTNNYNIISWSAVPGAVGYDVLKGNTSTLLASIASTATNQTSYNDQGATTSGYTPPTRNTTADAFVDGFFGIGTTSPTAALDVPASTTLNASSRVRIGTAPTTPNDGDDWYDTTQRTRMVFTNGVKRAFDGSIYTQTAYNVVVNTTAETSAIGTAKGIGVLTLPANFFVPGKTVRVWLEGTYQTPATPGSVVVKIKVGTTVLAQVTVAATILAASSTTRELQGWADITCYTNGTTGTLVCDGALSFEIATGTTTVPFSTAATAASPTATVTFNTTTAALVDVTETWSTANAAQGTTIGQGKLTEMY